MFTSHGKVTVKIRLKRLQVVQVFRDPSKIDNSYTHSKLRELSEVQSYSINTGALTEDMNSTMSKSFIALKST
jgi:hypothetical protein